MCIRDRALGHRWKIELSDYKGIMKLFVAVLSTVGRLIPFPVIYKLWKALCAKDKNKNTGQMCIRDSVLYTIPLGFCSPFFKIS